MSSSSSKGITISVTAETNAGGRRHMEDYLAVKLCPNEELRSIPHLKEQAYIGVFDGHGGKEAAKFAREKLWDTIQAQPKFRNQDIQSVRDSIVEAFLALHTEMEPLREQWKRNKMGDLSTAGTTASTVIFRQNHIYVANVGDSTAILAQVNPKAGEPGQHAVVAKVLTKDHKPEDPEETKHIEKLGGQVMLSRKRVPRVVWERSRTSKDANGGKTTQVDFIPFLSVSRSLGDFWSFNPRTRQFVVSPRPDVYVHSLNPKEQKFIVIASDGLWNVMSPREVVEFIWDYEHDNQNCHQPRDVVRAVINEALRKWSSKNLLADNIAVLIAFLSEGEEKSPSVAGIRSVDETNTSAESTSSTPSPNITTADSSRQNGPSPPHTSPTHNSPPHTLPPHASPPHTSPPHTSPTHTSPTHSSDQPSPSSTSNNQPSSSQTATSSPPPLSPPHPSLPHSSSAPSVISETKTSASSSSTYVKETFPDGVTVEYHTKIRLRHRKKHRSAESAKLPTKSPKRERPVELANEELEEESPAKRLKVDTTPLTNGSDDKTLTDSGCDTDHMDVGEELPKATDHASSDHSSGIFSDENSPKETEEKCELADTGSQLHNGELEAAMTT